MPAVLIAPADLAPFAQIDDEKALAMIADVLALARMVAPCIDKDDFAYPDAAKAILRGEILRWNDTGSGVRTQVTETIGPFSQSESYQQPQRRSLLAPSVIAQLEKLCADSSSGKAWGYDTVGSCSMHQDVCSLVFGATFCSCGADLAGFPLWETNGA